MEQQIPKWKYERSFNFNEGVSSMEGTRYDLRDNEEKNYVLPRSCS